MPDTQAPQQQQFATICDLEGHEYQFGACVDCDALDPNAPEEDGAPLGVVIDDVNFGSYSGLGEVAA